MPLNCPLREYSYGLGHVFSGNRLRFLGGIVLIGLFLWSPRYGALARVRPNWLCVLLGWPRDRYGLNWDDCVPWLECRGWRQHTMVAQVTRSFLEAARVSSWLDSWSCRSRTKSTPGLSDYRNRVRLCLPVQTVDATLLQSFDSIMLFQINRSPGWSSI